MLKTLASPRRQEIVRLAWDRERSAGAIREAMPDITFGAVSLQLKLLVEAGVLAVRPEGRYRYYRARRDAMGPVAAILEQIWDNALYRLTLAAELEQSRRGPLPRETRVSKRANPRSTTPPSRTRRS